MIKTTPLHESHKSLGARMGEFAGYDMPLYYPEGVVKEHEWTRNSAGLFDVSHMGQVSIKGKGAQDFLQKLTPSSFGKLGINRAKYTVLTNPQGGIVDDLMVTKTGEDDFHLVINAGCKDKDIAWMKNHLPSGLEFEHYEDWSLLALQGPKAEGAVREALGIDLSDLPYMALWYKDHTMFISRLGYTGEDGFEISVPANKVLEVWKALLKNPAVKPVGLAARDSLRLEMGYPLYGHDIDDKTTPVEAGLTWVMTKGHAGYIGADRIVPQLEKGSSRLRVGIKLTDRGVAREGSKIRHGNDDIGIMTSGGFSPTLKESIGMAYVDSAFAKPGETVSVVVRDKSLAAKVCALPFVPAKTKSMKKKEAA